MARCRVFPGAKKSSGASGFGAVAVTQLLVFFVLVSRRRIESGVKAGNKGFETAIAAIEMISIHRKLAEKEVPPPVVKN